MGELKHSSSRRDQRSMRQRFVCEWSVVRCTEGFEPSAHVLWCPLLSTVAEMRRDSGVSHKQDTHTHTYITKCMWLVHTHTAVWFHWSCCTRASIYRVSTLMACRLASVPLMRASRCRFCSHETLNQMLRTLFSQISVTLLFWSWDLLKDRLDTHTLARFHINSICTQKIWMKRERNGA